MTKIAVICLAYLGNPVGIEWMSDYFSALDATIFLHVDAKVSCENYQGLQDRDNIRFIFPRHIIFWGGFHTVSAIIYAIEFALRYGQFDRFILLTEDTLPIRELSKFSEAMMSDKNFIVAGARAPDWVLRRYHGYFCYDDNATCPRTDPRNKEVGPGLVEKLLRLERLRLQGKKKVETLYHGPTWWALKADDIRRILERHHSDSHLRESFEFSEIPEEQYFQTIYGEIYGHTFDPLVLTDFTRQQKPYVFSSIEEIQEQAMSWPCLFLRKADLSAEHLGEYVRALARE